MAVNGAQGRSGIKSPPGIAMPPNRGYRDCRHQFVDIDVNYFLIPNKAGGDNKGVDAV